MTFAISREAMENEFGAENLITVPAGRLNPVITHEPTARFLTEVGVPADDGAFPFIPDDELASGTRGALDAQSNLGDFTDEPLGDWVVLGWYGNDMFLLDGATGHVWINADGAGTVNFLSTRLDFFARFLAAFHRDDELLSPDTNTPKEIESAMDNIVVEVRGFDSEGVDHEKSYWSTFAERLAWEF